MLKNSGANCYWTGGEPLRPTLLRTPPCCNHPLPLLDPPTVFFFCSTAPAFKPANATRTARGASGKSCASFFRKCTTKKNMFFCRTRRDFSTKTKMERKDFLEKQLRWTEQFPVCWDAPLELSQLFANVLFLPPHV